MRSTLRRGILITSLSLGATRSSDAGAQSGTHERQCREAAAIVARAKPDPKMDWAWSTLLGCGAEGGLVARDAWLNTRTQASPRQLEELYRRLWSFRDAALFEAARRIATDASASAPSRVYSVMLLDSQLLADDDPSYAWFTSVGPRGVCRIGTVSDKTMHPGAPLRPDARRRALRVGQQLAGDATAPAIVRSAGRCLTQALTVDEELKAAGQVKPPRS